MTTEDVKILEQAAELCLELLGLTRAKCSWICRSARLAEQPDSPNVRPLGREIPNAGALREPAK